MTLVGKENRICSFLLGFRRIFAILKTRTDHKPLPNSLCHRDAMPEMCSVHSEGPLDLNRLVPGAKHLGEKDQCI